jgi:uncharacterized repeat protein (TIGR03803 family)
MKITYSQTQSMLLGSSRSAKCAIVRTTIFLLLVCTTESLRALPLTMIYDFSGSPDGNGPRSALIQDSKSNLYGTTYGGGTLGYGTVFKIDATGKESILHNFAGGADGSNPVAGLTLDAAGNLYGTTFLGGGNHCFNNSGCGVVFMLSPGGGNWWKKTILYSFKGGADGSHPGYGNLSRDAAGGLYGTTVYGGTGYCSYGCGVVYKISLVAGVWKEQVLHTFVATLSTDGATPYGGVILDAAGNLYGATTAGGNAACSCGTLFQLGPTGQEIILHSFAGGTDGAQPFGTLLRDASGNLYGTTWLGGSSLNYGIAFKLDTNGIETILHTFIGYPSDGASPYGALVQDSAGNLYGTTYTGGKGGCKLGTFTVGCGAVFKLDSTNTETILHNFYYATDGSEPMAGLLIGGNGNLYGATSRGGPMTARAGVLYKMASK